MSTIEHTVESLRLRLSPAARSLWAKSGDDHSRSEGEEPWLALPQHMLDAAEVAGLLWDDWASESVIHDISRFTRLSSDDARTLLIWLAATHDLGKATLTFQRQLEERAGFAHFMERLRTAGLSDRMSPAEQNIPRFPHSLGSRVLARTWLTDHGVPSLPADRLAGVLDAHHGSPSDPAWRTDATTALKGYTGGWEAVHGELLDFAAEITGISEVLPALRTPIVASCQMLLTGLVIMADWIASNSEVFPLSEEGISGSRGSAGYFQLDLTPPWLPAPPGISSATVLDEHLRSRFDWPSSHVARPVQRVVADACRALDGPGLVIIEAPTGEGKTEAALTAAEILAARSGAGGVMVAAPTMATADGLFRRVLAWSRHASGSEVTSMYLGHSKSQLNRDYRKLSFDEVGMDEQASGEGAVIASQWMSGRKKGMLSNFSVGTVDQVLFMALQAKHSMLRHLGLAGKVVVIDEVHAYDAYMSEYLAMALEWLARYRVPVVLLSATLPAAQKRALVEAYRRQLDSEPLGELSLDYPLVTAVGADRVLELAVKSRGGELHTSLEVIDDSVEDLARRIDTETVDGGCVLVICNTVRRAQETYLRLQETAAGEIELHHAAFLASERARKEEALREKLGPGAHRGDGRPHRRIVVATQVAEQSLDIDVDLLITDLAPIDLVIQRIGRLHRHDRPTSDRPENLQAPRVLLRGIESLDPPLFEAGTEAVYGRMLLLATLALLMDGPFESGFTRPTDIAPFVHRVYGDRPPTPVSWKETWDSAVEESVRERESSRRRADTFRIPPPSKAADLRALFEHQKIDVDSARGESAGLAQVRDSDPTIEVIPILLVPEGYRPLTSDDAADTQYPDQNPSEATATGLAASTVRLPAWMTRFESQFDRVLDQLEPLTPPGWQQSWLLKGQLALPLDGNGRVSLLDRILAYDDELGLHDVTDSEDPPPPVGPVDYGADNAADEGAS